MRPNLITRLKEEWNNLDPVDPLRGLIADAIEALEQPAQKRPQNCGTGYCSCIECLFEQPNIDKYLEKDNSEQPAQQQEPVAWINWCAATGKRSVSFECESELASQPLYEGITQNTQYHY